MKQLGIFIYLFIFSVISQNISAQSCAEGSTLIQGYVKDSAARNIPWVPIKADGDNGTSLTAITDENGFYQIKMGQVPLTSTTYTVSANMAELQNSYYFTAINLTEGANSVQCGTLPTPTANFTALWKERSIEGYFKGSTNPAIEGSFVSPVNTAHPNLSFQGKSVTLKCVKNTDNQTTTVAETTLDANGNYAFPNIQNLDPCINGNYKLASNIPNFMLELDTHYLENQTIPAYIDLAILPGTASFPLKKVINLEFILKFIFFNGLIRNNDEYTLIDGAFNIKFTGSQDGEKILNNNGGTYYSKIIGCDPITATPTKPGFNFSPPSITQTFPACADGKEQFYYAISANFVATASQPYSIRGFVINSDSTPIAGATVAIKVGTFTSQMVTGANGEYTFNDITEVGRITIKATKGSISAIINPPEYDGISTIINLPPLDISTSPTCIGLDALVIENGIPNSINIRVYATNFINIGTATLKINYDPTILTFIGPSTANGMTIEANNGVLSLTRSSQTPLSLYNYEALVTLEFFYKGGTTSLTFQDAPSTAFIDGNGNTVCHAFSYGPKIMLEPSFKGIFYSLSYTNIPNLPRSRPVRDIQIIVTGKSLPTPIEVNTLYSVVWVKGLIEGEEYQVSVSKKSNWCDHSYPILGVNATDAQWIMDNYLGNRTFDDLQKTSADVNNSGNANMTDALQVLLRAAGNLTQFEKGDWSFAHNPRTIRFSGINFIQEYYGMAVGDVDGSCASSLTTNKHSAKSEEIVTKLNQVKVDLGLNSNANIRAATVFITLPQGISVEKIEAPLLKGFVYGVENNILKFLWTDTKVATFTPGMPLFTAWFNNPNATPFNIKIENVLSNAAGEPLEMLLSTTQHTSISTETELPNKNALYSPYPNPFSENTHIPFSLTEAQNVSLKVYNMLGQEVAVLAQETHFEAGNHELSLDGTNLPNGVYLVRLTTPFFQQNQRMTRIK